MGLERKKAIYDVCVEYGVMVSSCWTFFRFVSNIGERYYNCGG